MDLSIRNAYLNWHQQLAPTIGTRNSNPEIARWLSRVVSRVRFQQLAPIFEKNSGQAGYLQLQLNLQDHTTTLCHSIPFPPLTSPPHPPVGENFTPYLS